MLIDNSRSSSVAKTTISKDGSCYFLVSGNDNLSLISLNENQALSRVQFPVHGSAITFAPVYQASPDRNLPREASLAIISGIENASAEVEFLLELWHAPSLIREALVNLSQMVSGIIPTCDPAKLRLFGLRKSVADWKQTRSTLEVLLHEDDLVQLRNKTTYKRVLYFLTLDCEKKKFGVRRQTIYQRKPFAMRDKSCADKIRRIQMRDPKSALEFRSSGSEIGRVKCILDGRIPNVKLSKRRKLEKTLICQSSGQIVQTVENSRWFVANNQCHIPKQFHPQV